MRTFRFLTAIVALLGTIASASEGRLPPIGDAEPRHAEFRSSVSNYGAEVEQQAYEQSGGGSVYPADEVEPLFDGPAGPNVPGPSPGGPGKSFPGARPGIFQGGNAGVTWLAGDDLQMTDLVMQGSFGIPFPAREAPVIFTPGYGLHLLDGSVDLDVPSQLHDAWLETRFPRRLTERLMADFAVAVGYYSDFENRSDNAIRITGRALALYDWTPTTKLALGVVYLDRNDVSVLPAAGLTWTPTPDRKVELIFPRPRIAWRTYRFQEMDPSNAEWWYYVAGEFGGNTWAVTRADDSPDELTYRDYRVVFGLERKPLGLTPSRLEAAYIFGRALEYSSNEQEVDVDDTFMGRLVWGF